MELRSQRKEVNRVRGLVAKFVRLFRDNRGITTAEALIVAALLAILALATWQNLKNYTKAAADTIGSKVNNAVGSNNPSW
ncbi:hypothetical protein SAMN00808754_1520 [Thermanaeromonas toyohensis ToBE]|uniref:Uncharacterized protein n=1 Tax=Thermanaeromonas toyohensis ToBE TaxID=698762 RepID=A0A1W1VT02_9FIRM|nr:hypothetical protein [Thermanaeromonas toyohensis]SMB96515.1 hypothetical protein SAMN00808754_1520 [Thermanaeromonas toyohensis ToBE]